MKLVLLERDGEPDHLSQFLLTLLISPFGGVSFCIFDRKPGIRVESRQQSLFAKTGDPDKRFFKYKIAKLVKTQRHVRSPTSEIHPTSEHL